MPRPLPLRTSGLLAGGLVVLLPVALLPVVLSSASAQPAAPESSALFTPLPDFSLASRDAQGDPSTVRPADFTAYRLDPERARSILAVAPSSMAGEQAGEQAGVEISVPDPDGDLVTFEVVEDSVLQPALAAAHPEIATYAGRAVDDSGRSIRLGVTDLGFHASVRSPGGAAAWYVDPAFTEDDASRYLSYYGAAVPEADDTFVERDLGDTQEILAGAPAGARPAPGGLVSRRTYRLAFVTDPTYAAYYGSGSVLSAKAMLLNRVNQIYNDDLAIQFQLIDGTDALNLDTPEEASGPNGPCGASGCFDRLVYEADPATPGDGPNGCSGALLTRTEFALGQLVGADTYDIGHIGLGVNGGGIAGLGVVGGDRKSAGCTGLAAPDGDFYAVDYFAHEIGHQMGGNHTFNGTQRNCSLTNRNGGTSVEPGSGSSVMAYAGICAQDNLQPHSDPYFSQRSVDEIDRIVNRAANTVSEFQTVTLRGFDAAGETFRLGYPGAAPVTVTRGAGYNTVTLTQAVQRLTGCLPRIAGYDPPANTPSTPGDNGFVVTFTNPDCSGTDLARLQVLGGDPATPGAVTGFVGVQDNGGPSTNGGSTVVVTANHAPTVSAGLDRTIPRQTPFFLNGSSTDVDAGDTARSIYLWEQNDTGAAPATGGTALVSNTKIDGPLFRVFGTFADVTEEETLEFESDGLNEADTSATRTFPDLEQILDNNTNAVTGACPEAAPLPTDPATPIPPVEREIVDCFSEFLPTADYGAPSPGAPSTGGSMTFRLTTRDLFPTGGGSQFDDVTLSVDPGAGPFLVSSRAASGAPATGGAPEAVTWDVAGTDTAAMAENVRVSLSTDGGRTYPFVMAASTPNDGAESLALPNVSTTRARIRVEAVGNYFFDLNDEDFVVERDPSLPETLPTGTGTSPSTPPVTVPGTTPAVTPLSTRSRVRLSQSRVVRGARPARLRYGVFAARASAGRAGRVVVRLDGRRVAARRVPVALASGRRVLSSSYRVPRLLAVGEHRLRVRFKPRRSGAYLPSRSRVVTLRVVRPR